HPALRMVEFYVFNFGGWDRSGCANRDIDHGNALVLSNEAQSLGVSSHGSSGPPMPAPGSTSLLRCLRLFGARRQLCERFLFSQPRLIFALLLNYDLAPHVKVPITA